MLFWPILRYRMVFLIWFKGGGATSPQDVTHNSFRAFIPWKTLLSISTNGNRFNFNTCNTKNNNTYRQPSNTTRNLVCNKIVDHSDVVGASSVDAAPITSSFSTSHLATSDWAKATARRYKNHLRFDSWFGSTYIRDLTVHAYMKTKWFVKIILFDARNSLSTMIMLSPCGRLNVVRF